MKNYFLVLTILFAQSAFCLSSLQVEKTNSVTLKKLITEDKPGKARDVEALYLRRTALRNNMNSLTFAWRC